MIQLSNPAALWWALLAVPIVLLYLTRTRPRRHPVATGFLWTQAIQTQDGRSRWRPWRGPVSLALQLTVLAILVLAMAGPRVPEPPRWESAAEEKAFDDLRTIAESLDLIPPKWPPINAWLVGSAGALVAIEWWLFHRRWTC